MMGRPNRSALIKGIKCVRNLWPVAAPNQNKRRDPKRQRKKEGNNGMLLLEDDDLDKGEKRPINALLENKMTREA